MNTLEKAFKRKWPKVCLFVCLFHSFILSQQIFIEGLLWARLLGYSSEQKRQKFLPLWGFRCSDMLFVNDYETLLLRCEVFNFRVPSM